MSWELTTLSEYFEISSSKRVFKKNWADNGVPFYRAREIVKLAKNESIKNALFISDEMYAEYATKYGIPEEGDILVTSVGTLGIVYIVKAGDKFYFKDGNIIWLKKKKSINSEFIEYAFKTDAIQRYIQNSAGATVGIYTITKAKKTPLSLPPLAEQQKITAILDAADQLRQKDQQLIDHYTTLSQSLFLDMFGDPVVNPMGWQEYKLSEVSEKITDGTHKTPKYVADGVLFLSAKNIKENRIVLNSVKYITQDEHDLLCKRCNVEVGDILITKSGSIGMAGIVDININFSIFESLALIKYLRSLINGKFLLYFMNTPSTQYQYNRYTKGVGVKHLHLRDLRQIKIILPPQDLQNQFAQHIEKIEQQKQYAQASLEKSETLFNSLLQRAFKGELT